MTERKPCWECSKKRRVCDFTRPHCHKCQSRGVDCPGYEKKPLKWLQPGQTRSKGKRARSEASDGSNESECRAVASRLSTPPITAVLHFEGLAMVEGINYYNSVVCPDMEAIGDALSQSPFCVDARSIKYLAPSVIESVISVSLGHRMLQSGDQSVELAKRLQSHRGKAIRLLTSELSAYRQETADVTLLSIFIFLLAEVQQSISPTWRQHFDGAQAIIKMNGGLRNMLLSRSSFHHLFRYFILFVTSVVGPSSKSALEANARRDRADVFGATTTPNLTVPMIEHQVSICDQLQPLYKTGLATTVPCAPELMQQVILVNRQRAMNTTLGFASATCRHTSMLQILGRIQSFSAEQWAFDVASEQQQLIGRGREANMPDVASPTADAWDWTLVGQVYQAAVALYCITSLSSGLTEMYQTPENLQQMEKTRILKESCHGSLLEGLKAIASSNVQQLRKLVIWPLVIAGIVREGDEDDTNTFILDELLYISRALGTASPLVARDLVKRLWASSNLKLGTGYGEMNVQWDTLFDRPYCFVV